MPVNRKMMNSMRKQYGEERGEDIYYATENKRKHKLADSISRRRKPK